MSAKKGMAVAAGLLLAGVMLAGPGGWRRLGPAGAWKRTQEAVTRNGALYTIESSGVLYSTNLADGSWKAVGKPEWASLRFLMEVDGYLYGFDAGSGSGSLYRIHPGDGSWKQVGKVGDWANTVHAVALHSRIYSIEKSGALYVTNPADGTWQQVGKPEWASTKFLLASQDLLGTGLIQTSLPKLLSNG